MIFQTKVSILCFMTVRSANGSQLNEIYGFFFDVEHLRTPFKCLRGTFLVVGGRDHREWFLNSSQASNIVMSWQHVTLASHRIRWNSGVPWADPIWESSKSRRTGQAGQAGEAGDLPFSSFSSSHPTQASRIMKWSCSVRCTMAAYGFLDCYNCLV